MSDAGNADKKPGGLAAVGQWLLDRDQRWRALRVFRGFLDDGRATFLLLSGLILVTATAFRQAALQIQNSLTGLKDDTDRLLQADYEVRRDTHYPAVLGALLAKQSFRAPLNLAGMCERAGGPDGGRGNATNEIDCDMLDKVLRTTTEKWTKATSLPDANEEWRYATKRWNGQPPAGLQENVVRFMQRCLHDKPELMLATKDLSNPCQDVRDTLKNLVAPEYCGARGEEAAKMTCDAQDAKRQRRSRLFMVSQADMRQRRIDMLRKNDSATPILEEIVWFEAAASLLLEESLAAAGELERACADPPNIDDERPRLVQVYFIGVNDVVRLWTCGQLSDPSRRHFRPTRRWTPARYFEAFQADPALSEYISGPYVDYAGMGVVRTYCKPLKSGAGEGDLRAVVCGDISVPFKDLTDDLENTRLVKRRFVKIGPPRNGAFDKSAIELYDPDRKETAAKENEDDEILSRQIAARLTREAESLKLGESGALEDLAREVLPMVIDDWAPKDETEPTEPRPGGLYANPSTFPGEHPSPPMRGRERTFTASEGPKLTWLVPVGRDGRALHAVLFEARGDLDDGVVPWVIATLVLLVATGTLGAVMLRHSQRWNAYAREQALLRNLQTGVLKLDEHLRIVEANDRAEQLLGVALPRIGTEGSSDLAQPFLDLIEPEIAKRAGKNYTLVPFLNVIPQERRRGKASAYYVRLRGQNTRRRWLRVHASPMFFFDGQVATLGAAPRSFGVLEPVGKERCAKLDKLWIERHEAVFVKCGKKLVPINDPALKMQELIIPGGIQSSVAIDDLLQEPCVRLTGDIKLPTRGWIVREKFGAIAGETEPYCARRKNAVGHGAESWILVRVYSGDDKRYEELANGDTIVTLSVLASVNGDLAERLAERFASAVEATHG
ncbi:PAS domain-containing protein [Sorangium sp. So ce1000]|uniref:PAS domain-containing protein n=1 Tax=Sorangium sp. So ce1000 TaxID=3133325 RepID=UPI003F64502D